MSKQEEEEQARLERAREVGLFRYMLIREAADPVLTTRQRGAMVRAVAAREHKGPSGEPVRLTRWTLDKWIRDWRRGGFDALVPAPRQSQPRATPDQAAVFGRFEASRPNEIWTGDALHAIRVDGRKTYLFAFIDDHSRAVMAARFGFAEDTIRLAAALRPALASRGVPEHVYVDNGSAFVDAWLLRAC